MTKIYRIFKNAKKIKQLSENNKLKPIIKKHTFKTKLKKNILRMCSYHKVLTNLFKRIYNKHLTHRN